MAEDLGERTETATSRRREEARQRGQIVASRDLSAAVIIIAATAGFQFLGEGMIGDAIGIFHYCLRDAWLDLGVDRLRVESGRLLAATLLMLIAWFAIVVGAALAIHLWQAQGLQVATRKNYLNFNAFNPIGGLRRVFSLRGLMKTLLDVAKVIVVGLVAYFFIAGEMERIVNLPFLSFPIAARYAFGRAVVLAYELAAVLLLLGITDWIYQKYQFEQDLKMTKQEVKEEQKDIEGDPKIRAQRRRIQMQMAARRMMARVPEAEVVITNPTELAVALKYDPYEMNAPIVVAKGAGVIAERIRKLAVEHDVPVIENKPLAQLLFFKADVDRVIPEETFVVVAEILAYVYQLTGKQAPIDAEQPA